MSNKNTGRMKATNIAHLVGQMDVILETMEFSIQQVEMEDYQEDFLMNQISEAKAVNEKIFEMHEKNELDKIKKTYNDENE